MTDALHMRTLVVHGAFRAEAVQCAHGKHSAFSSTHRAVERQWPHFSSTATSNETAIVLDDSSEYVNSGGQVMNAHAHAVCVQNNLVPAGTTNKKKK
ncbi:MAG: hypothetical protein EOO65_00875 [Methanosarcinales archaeon]|nr:MAG: hypothetical protein EOO65_00875 [Methanosarcinales archaeon]